MEDFALRKSPLREFIIPSHYTVSSNTHLHLFLINCSSDENDVTHNFAKAEVGFKFRHKVRSKDSQNSEGFSPGCLLFAHHHTLVLGHFNILCDLRHHLAKVYVPYLWFAPAAQKTALARHWRWRRTHHPLPTQAASVVHATGRPRERSCSRAATREPNWISLAMLRPVLGWGGKNKKRLEQRVKWQKSLSAANRKKRVETREK